MKTSAFPRLAPLLAPALLLLTLASPARAALPALPPAASPDAPVPAPQVPGPDTPVEPASPAPVNADPVAPEPTLPTGPAPISTLRGLWVDAFGPGLKTRAQVARTVEDAVALGINTLIVQAVRRSDCLCRRSSLPLVTDKDLEQDFDPLAEVLRLAHPRGLRVIAWISVTGAASTGVPNTNPGHVFQKHGPNAGARSWLSRRPDGSWQEGGDAWLDPAIPAAADHMVAGVVSLVKNYRVDGVQLDRIRYPDGGAWGYDAKSLARYRAETGTRGTPAPADPRWQAWKREQVTALVRRIALGVKGVRPGLWTSAATITYGAPPAPGDLTAFRKSRTYMDVLQDWPTWMRDGLIDLNVLMNYKRDAVGQQGAWLDGWNAFAASVRGRAEVAGGTALYLNTPAVSASQARRTVETGLGWVGYSYRTPTLDVYNARQTTAQGLTAIRTALTAPGGALAEPVLWTALPPHTGGLSGRVVGTTTPGGRVVEAVRGGQVLARVLTDGGGYYGFLNLPPGPVEVRVSGQRWPGPVPEVGVVRFPDLLVRDTVPAGRPAR